MQKECKQCGKAISNKATYCSDRCRIAYSRNPNKTEANPNKQPEHSQPEQPRTQPEQNPEQTRCKGCQKPVHHLVDICHEYIAKGLTRKKLGLPEVKMEIFTDKPGTQMNWQRKGWTHKEAIERAIYSIAEIGCDCIVGNKIYESKRVLKAIKL